MNETSEKNYVGELVNAKCLEVTDRRVISEFGEGQKIVVARNEWPDAEPGMHKEIYVEGEARTGLWAGVISKVEAVNLWNRIEKLHKDNADIDVTAVACESNGLICDLLSLCAFMPRREIEPNAPQDLSKYIGKRFKARILKFSEADCSIIVSHRTAAAEELKAAKDALLSSLAVGQTYDGTVRQIVDFGAFVDIGAGVEGLVHRSNLSWNNAEPAKILKTGDPLKVTVLALENGRISLGHKQLTEDDWAARAEGLHAGDIVEGRVTHFSKFGAFVQINGQIDGLLHDSEVSWDRSVRRAQQVLKIDDIIKVKILEVDPEKRKLRLSLRQTDDNPWQVLKDTCPAGTTLKGAIISIADFGLFVDIGHGQQGLIHRNDIPLTDSKADLNTLYHVGDEIEFAVMEIDTERKRAKLSIRQLAGDPFQNFLAQNPLGHQFDATITRIAKFGAFAQIGDVEGLIHISQLSDKRVETVESVVSTGQAVKVTVINIDEKKRRIGLSLTAEPFEPQAEDDAAAINKAEAQNSRATIADIFPQKRK